MARDLGKRKGGRARGHAGAPPAAPADGDKPGAGTTGPAVTPAGVTPSMAQFLEIKAANPDCLLFYRMGDFYELFFEDAVAAAQALSIVLTKRGKHLGDDIPMCGVPVHRADEYLQRLIKLGFRVAVCEQLEDPAEARKRGSKAVVRRDVVRLVTPGEVIAADRLLADEGVRKWIGIAGAAATPVAGASFDSLAGERLLKARLGVADLQAFGQFSRAELAAVGGLLKYVELTQIGKMPCLRPPRRAGPANRLVIDAASRASLELRRALSGERQGSLLFAIDRTATGPGARELAARLSSPLRDPIAIAARLDAVGFLHQDETLRIDLRGALRAAPDIARAISRLALQRGGPRDLAAVRDGLATAAACARLLHDGAGGIGLPEALADIARRLAGCGSDLADLLTRALVDDPPHQRRDGGFVR